MAFGGDSGGAAAMLAVGTLRSPLGVSITYNGDNTINVLNGTGPSIVAGGPLTNGPSAHINSLLIRLNFDGDAPLGAYVDGTTDGGVADTGILTTAVPAGNTTGIPANFGPGRGNWSGVVDISRLTVQEYYNHANYNTPADYGTLVRRVATVAAGNLVITWKNLVLEDILAMDIVLSWDHSQVV